MALTGKIDFKRGLFGNVIMLVEEEAPSRLRRKPKLRWRRAKLIDLASPELRILIDMRTHPHISTRTVPGTTAASTGSFTALPRPMAPEIRREENGVAGRLAH